MNYNYSHCTDEKIKIKMPTHLLKFQQLISIKARLELKNSGSSDKPASKYKHDYTLTEKCTGLLRLPSQNTTNWEA